MSYPSPRNPRTNEEIIANDAVHEWWIQPLSTYLDSPYPRIVNGAISSTGKILACEFDILKNITKRIEAGTIEVDDHNTPALWAEEGRRFLLGWSGHDSSNNIFFKCSNKKGEVASFEDSDLYTYVSAVSSSYVQIIKINHLCSENEDVFWVFNRRATTNWQIIPVHVNQDTGEIRFGLAIVLVTSSIQSYITISDANNTYPNNQVIRIAWGYNPALSLHAVFGFNIDVVTGAITNVSDDTFTANLDGTNLPISDAVPPVAFISEPLAGNSRRLFYVRPGPDAYAVAYADWAIATPNDATYRVKEFSNIINGEGLRVGPGTNVANAEITYDAAMQTNTFEYMTFFTFTSPSLTSEAELGRRSNDGNDGMFWLRIRPNRTVVVNLSYAGSSGNPFPGLGTVPIPGKWTDKIGLRLVVDNALTPKVVVDYSLDDGTTWTNLELANPAGLAGGMKVSSAPMYVGAKNIGNTNRGLIIHSASLKTATGGTLIAGVNFGAEWPDGETVFTDTAGRSWALTGDSYVDGLDDQPSVTDYGISGPRVGYIASANYIAGMAFQSPSKDRIVYTAHSTANVETIKKHSQGTEETLITAYASDARLIRPYSPKNTGPYEVIYISMDEYSQTTYTDYLGSIKIK